MATHDPAPDPDDDDAAFTWAGDEERGQDAPSRRRAAEARAARADGPGTELDGDDYDDDAVVDPDLAAPARPLRTALTAVFALVYLVFTIAWILAVQRTGSSNGQLVFAVLDQFGMFTAIVAAPLWFGAVLTLTRTASTAVRVGWLALGAGVLVPWPLVLVLLAAVSA